MRRLIRWAAWLYPAAWRARYGPEFHALLDDVDPPGRDFWNVLGGALKMQMTSWNFGRIAAVGALAGIIVAGALTYSQPNQYISTAVLRLTPSAPSVDAHEHLMRMQQQVMSRSSLGKMITQPSLDLYKKDREQRPLEDVIQDMRNKSIRIRPVGTSAFSIEYSYPNKYKAQAVLRNLVTAFVEQNVMKQIPPAADQGALTLEVLDPASLPERPSSPNWPRALLLGAGGGLVAGAITALLFAGPKLRNLKIAGAGIAGFVIVGAASFLIPNQYISSAVLRSKPGGTPVEQLLDNDLLAKVVIAQGARAGVSSVDALRTRLQIRPVQIPTSTAYVISFRSSNADSASAVVREIINQAIEKQHLASAPNPNPAWRTSPSLEILDPASMPNAPSSPNRLTIASLGLLAGLIAGAWLLRAKRTPLPA